jgi:6-phosphofructokinase 1
VTCGGLCPGLNNVIRGLVLELAENYGVAEILGFRNGYQGLVNGCEPVPLTPALVAGIHNRGGTILGTSRGGQDEAEIVATLARLGVSVLFVIGGDGTLRGCAGHRGRRGRPRGGPRGGGRAEDHRQRHPVHRPQLRVPDRVRPGGGLDPGRAH